MNIAGLIYTLCAVTALICAWLLLQAYYYNRYKLLLWGGICFVGLSLNNMLLMVDKLIFHYKDMHTWRFLLALISLLVLLYGLVWESE
jgi:hypothetical protein